MRRLLALLVPVCLAAGLAACSPAAAGPGPSPVTELPAPAAASPSAAASEGGPPASPALPPEAAVQDRAGATAFIGHWFDLLNAAYASGDPTALEQASTAECTFCRNVAEGIRAEAQAGEVREGGEVRVVDVAVPPGEPGEVAFLANGVIAQDAGRIHDADGETVAPISGAETIAATVLVTWLDGGWRCDGVALTER